MPRLQSSATNADRLSHTNGLTAPPRSKGGHKLFFEVHLRQINQKLLQINQLPRPSTYPGIYSGTKRTSLAAPITSTDPTMPTNAANNKASKRLRSRLSSSKSVPMSDPIEPIGQPLDVTAMGMRPAKMPAMMLSLVPEISRPLHPAKGCRHLALSR